MAESDLECALDPAALLQMGYEDYDTEYTGVVDESEDPLARTDQSNSLPPEERAKLKSFEDETQYIALMELANGIQVEEMEARGKFFNLNIIDYPTVLGKFYSHCTMCDSHVPVIINNQYNFMGHPILKTLICRKCYDFYGDGNFERGDDGVDLYCRWCAEGGKLFCCSSCPNAFCEKCVRRNFGSAEVKKVNDADTWNCYVCEPKHLWGHRAAYSMIQTYLQDSKSSFTPDKKDKDLSNCCYLDGDKLTKNRRVFVQYCPEVFIPQINYVNKKKGPVPVIINNNPPQLAPLSKLRLVPQNRIVNPVQPLPPPPPPPPQQQQQQNDDVNDFFANGHFLDAALPTPPKPQALPQVISLPRQKSVTMLLTSPVIRPKLLSTLQPVSSVLKRSDFDSNQKIRFVPNLLKHSTPQKKNIGRIYLNNNKVGNNTVSISSNRQPINSNASNIQRSTMIVNSHTNTRPSAPNLVKRNYPQQNSQITPNNIDFLYEKYQNFIDSALLSSDFYKDEIVKLKIGSMDKELWKSNDYLTPVSKLMWVLKSVVDQIIEVRQLISSQFKTTGLNETVCNLDKLLKSKGGKILTNSTLKTPVRNGLGPKPVQSNTSSASRNVINFTSNTPNKPNLNSTQSNSNKSVNGSSSDVVDLVSDDEDASLTPNVKRAAVRPPHMLGSGISKPYFQGTPNRPPMPLNSKTPIVQGNNRFIANSNSKKRKRKKGSEDDSDDDYVPSTNGSPRSKKKKRTFSMNKNLNKSINNLSNNNNSGFTSGLPKLLVTDVRTVQDTAFSEPSQKSTNLSSVDIMSQVLQQESGDDSDLEELPMRSIENPLEDEDKDDWITKNPSNYEKYCREYQLSKDWFIGVKDCKDKLT